MKAITPPSQVENRGTHKLRITSKKAAVREFQVGDDLLLLDPRTGTLHRLNSTSRVLWNYCRGRTVQELESLLTDRYNIGAETAHAHVEQFVEVLQSAALLEVTGTGSNPESGAAC